MHLRNILNLLHNSLQKYTANLQAFKEEVDYTASTEALATFIKNK